MTSSPKAQLITEYGRKAGQGHLFRCLAYAQQLKIRGWNCQLRLFHIIEGEKQAVQTSAKNLKQSKLKALPSFLAKVLSEGFEHIEVQNLSLHQLQQSKRFWQEDAEAGELLLIDSYHLPFAFYQVAAKTQQCKYFLALDDFERLSYPEGFTVVQTSMLGFVPRSVPKPAGPVARMRKGTLYLRGLAYQVLRPEFSRNSPSALNLHGKDQDAPWGQIPRQVQGEEQERLPYILVIPGSAFSSEQLGAWLARRIHEAHKHWMGCQQQHKGKNYQVLLSASHSALDVQQSLQRTLAARAWNVPHHITLLGQLHATALRRLYLRASYVSCAASQSLLEVLAVRGSEANCEVLLTADNQVELAKQFACIPKTDLRPSLLAAKPLQATRKKKRKKKQEGNLFPKAELSPTLVKQDATACLDFLADGKALDRILAMSTSHFNRRL